MDETPNTTDPLDPQSLTWAVMLGRWVDFARSATALPTDGPEGLLRDSVTDIITLQAVWFSLSHLDALPYDEQAIGLDRSQVLIDRHAEALRTRFSSHPPRQIEVLIADAESKLAEARLSADPSPGHDVDPG